MKFLKSQTDEIILNYFIPLEIKEKKINRDVEGIISFLNSDDPIYRENSAWALGMIKDRRAVKPLTERLKSDENDMVRKACAWALGEIGGEEAYKALVSSINDESPEVRRIVAWSFEKIKNPDASTHLLKLLDDSSPLVRKAAVFALGVVSNKNDPRIIEALKNKLKDNSPDVRREAVFSLGSVSEYNSEIFSNLIETRDPVVNEAIEHITSIPSKAIKLYGSAKNYIKDLGDPNPTKRERSAYILGKIRDVTSVPSLLNALYKENKKRPLKSIIRALGEIGSITSIVALIKIIQTAEVVIRKIIMGYVEEELVKQSNDKVIITAQSQPETPSDVKISYNFDFEGEIENDIEILEVTSEALDRIDIKWRERKDAQRILNGLKDLIQYTGIKQLKLIAGVLGALRFRDAIEPLFSRLLLYSMFSDVTEDVIGSLRKIHFNFEHTEDVERSIKTFVSKIPDYEEENKNCVLEILNKLIPDWNKIKNIKETIDELIRSFESRNFVSKIRIIKFLGDIRYEPAEEFLVKILYRSKNLDLKAYCKASLDKIDENWFKKNR